MKAITLTQPYATLVAIGAKKIETRSWRTDYRGPLAIHAAAGLGPVGGKRGLRDTINNRTFSTALMRVVPGFNRYCDIDNIIERLPLGAIVATCHLVKCDPTQKIVEYGRGSVVMADMERKFWPLTEDERAFGDYSPGRFAWLLADIRALPEPIPAKGALGLWEWDEK